MKTDEEREAIVKEVRAAWMLPEVEITRVITTGWGEAGHPFTIGPQHVAHASDHCGGMLGEATMNAIGCAHGRCGQKPDAHKEELGLLITLTRDMDEKTLCGALEAIKPIIAKHGVENIGFGGTDRYRIIREGGEAIFGPGSKSHRNKPVPKGGRG